MPQTQATIDETAESDLVDQQTLSPAEEAVANEMRGFIAQAISHLSETHRLAVTMYYVDGLSYRDIGEFLDVPQTTIKNRLHRARKQLKKELLKMVGKEFESQRLSDEFSEQVLQEVEVNHIFMGEEPDTINLPESSLFSVELKTYPIDSKHLPNLFKAQGVPLSKRINLSNAPKDLTIIIDRDNKQAYALKRDDNLLNVFKFPEIPKLGSSPIVYLKLKDNPQQQLPIWIGEP